MGYAVAVDGDIAVVGAPRDDAAGSEAGAAYIFVRSGSDWMLQQKLLGSDAAAGDNFGVSVAISGETAIVGANLDDVNGINSAGSACVYTRTGGIWTLQQKLTASDAGTSDRFGCSVGISGDSIIVGSIFDNDGGSDSGSAYFFLRSGATWSQQQKLNAPDAVFGDWFGCSVGISGDAMVIGAFGDDDAGSESGSAYAFARSGGVWSLQQKLMAADGAGGDRFGYSVGISGTSVVVGAYSDDLAAGNDAGSVHVFTRSGITWSLQQKLTASDAASADRFGYAVGISVDSIVVGADWDDSATLSDAGSAYVYVRSGNSWSQQQKLTASGAAAADHFGTAAAISGDRVVVGANLDDDQGGSSGSAFVFKRTVASWTAEDKLLAAVDDARFDSFGAAVDIEGGVAVVGAPDDDIVGADSGAVYFYLRINNQWLLQQKLTASDAAAGDHFGISVSLNGSSLVVGASGSSAGAAYVFVRSGDTWIQQQKLTAFDAAGGDSFGASVGISNDSLVIGAYGDDTAAGAHSGSAYIFSRTGGVWSLQQKLTPADALTFDHFGWSAAISGDTVVIGAVLDDTAVGANSGSAYVFTRSGIVWTEQQRLTSSDIAANDHFGYSVAFDGATLVVGSAWDDTTFVDAGSAYTFTRSGGTWNQQQKLIPSDTAASDFFGQSVGISGDKIIVGSYLDDIVAGSNAGSAYVFIGNGTVWSEQLKLTASNAAADDRLGSAVAIDADDIIVGAQQDDANGGDSGSASIFRLPAAPTITSMTPQIGPTTGGTLVAIYGTNFVGITMVTFDGVPLVSYSVVGSSQINAITNSHAAGAIDVVVANSGGSGSLGGVTDFTYAKPVVVAVEINGGPSVTLQGSGTPVSLAGQHSVVKQILVTFNQAVNVASDAFTVTPRTTNVTAHGPMPSAAVASTSVTMISSSIALLTFVADGGAGVHDDGIIKSGIYDLTTIASKVHANGETMAASRVDSFFALFGTIEGNNSYTSGPIGDGGSHGFVDPGSLFQFSDTFGATAVSLPGTPPYNILFDANLDGAIDPGDLFAFSDAFGSDWVF